MQGRQELKYICSAGELKQIELRLSGIADRDLHAEGDGTYLISSLYFDDFDNSCCRDNEAGVPLRVKYRARFYNGDPSTLHLEKKVRNCGNGYKYSCPMTARQLQCFYDGDVSPLLYGDVPPLLKELAVLADTRLMLPKSIVRYERTPFICSAGNVRITLDRAICGSADTAAFLSGEYAAIPLQPAGQELLEVKFDTVLPGWLRKAAWLDRLTQTSFSKYYLSRTALSGGGI